MKSIFYFPPNWSHSSPDMNIPSLMPYLQDFDITACDLNVQYRIYQRSRDNLDKCLERIKVSQPESLLEKYDMIYNFLVIYKVRVEYILHDIEHFVNPEKYILTSLYESELQLFHKTAYEKDRDINLWNNITGVIKTVDDKEENYYLDFYENYFQEHGLDDVEIVLVFPAGIQQVVSTFTLCGYIKKNYPAIKIIVGGNPFTELIDEIDQSWSILFEKLFDYIMVYEGEYALPDLLRCISGEQSVDLVPNCIHMQNKIVVKNAIDSRVIDIENSHLPDFSGYNLNSYNVPEIVLPYYVTRKCYEKKCSTCDRDNECINDFRIKSVEKVINDLCMYKEKYHAKYIHLADEAIPSEVIEKICQAILEKKLDIKWFTCIQPSGQYTKELCNLMQQAGAVIISDSAEVSSQNGQTNLISYLANTYIFEKEHLLFWIVEKQDILNDTYMQKEYMEKLAEYPQIRYWDVKDLAVRFLSDEVYV